MAALARRGPDSEGLHTWPGVALGHRRLAILDLSPAGYQPMLSDDGQIGLVFNGCIYNFLELRKDLEQRGHRFRSNSDTEVLLRGYLEWGADALARRLRGMYAFAIWDEPRRKLTLVRDRLGVKPLVYIVDKGEIAFASTITALRAAGLGGEINAGAVLDFLEFGYVTDEHAIFENFKKLPPATILEWQDGQMVERRYWRLPEAAGPEKIQFNEAVEETERRLVEAVRLRLVADVPIGALLSGGVDSGLVCWAMKKLNANVKAFTVGMPGDPSDETAAARQTAAFLGIAHEVVELPRGGPALLDEIVDAYSEPFGSQSAQAMLLVSRAVKSRATVLLTGDGGDDVFFGYPFFRNAWLAQRAAARLPDAAAPLWRATRPLIPASGPLKRMRSFLDFATEGLRGHALAHDGLPYYEQRGILGDRFRGAVLTQRMLEPSMNSARRLLFDVFAYHRKMHFTSEFMPKVDGATMYYSLEARSPFLDQEIWEFAATLSPQVRFQNGALKAVLREIARRRLGPAAAERPKQGFSVPVERWLAERWGGALNELKGNTLLQQGGWIQPGALSRAIDDALANKSVPTQLWYVLVLEKWLNRQTTSVGQVAHLPRDPASVCLLAGQGPVSR